MSLDLGNLLGNLGSQYISARWGQPSVPQVMAPTIQAQGPQAGLAVTPALAPAVGMGLGAAAGEAYDWLTSPSVPAPPVGKDAHHHRIVSMEKQEKLRLNTSVVVVVDSRLAQTFAT